MAIRLHGCDQAGNDAVLTLALDGADAREFVQQTLSDLGHDQLCFRDIPDTPLVRVRVRAASCVTLLEALRNNSEYSADL